MAETKRMTAEQVVGYLKGEGLDVLRESLAWVVQQLMEAEVSELISGEHGERNSERLTHRNGYRSRPWVMRAGEHELAIPKLRRGSYFPSFLEPRRRSEQALVSVVQEAYVAGVSTREVDQVIDSLGLRISKCEVSRICHGLDERSTRSATGRSRGAIRICGWTRRWKRSAEAAASCARRSCSLTACTSRATAR
jgi:putative transposase